MAESLVHAKATSIAPEEQEYLAGLVSAQREAQAALDGFAGFLQHKYKVGEGDTINRDGSIVRKAPDGGKSDDDGSTTGPGSGTGEADSGPEGGGTSS